jgi:hypothetical protein
MTDTDAASTPDAVAAAFDRHDAFAPAADGYALDSTAFDVTATATATDGPKAGRFTVTVIVPTLSATVADPDDVATVVEDGWFDTFERRLEDAFDVAKTSDGDEPVLDRSPDEVRVELTYDAWDTDRGVSDAKALAEYVEGTWVQGLVPGYDYVGAAADLRAAASRNAGGDDGDGRSGTPL